jgi:hypothetical protein
MLLKISRYRDDSKNATVCTGTTPDYTLREPLSAILLELHKLFSNEHSAGLYLQIIHACR